MGDAADRAAGLGAAARRRACGPRLLEVRPQRHLKPAPFLAAALAFLVPVLLVIALASPDANRPGRAAADTQTAATPPTSLSEQANAALLAGDYTAAVRLTREADPDGCPRCAGGSPRRSPTQARTAQRNRAYVRAIKLARRAARYGKAPGASAIVRQSRAGLDLRREEQQRRAATPDATDAG